MVTFLILCLPIDCEQQNAKIGLVPRWKVQSFRGHLQVPFVQNVFRFSKVFRRLDGARVAKK